MYTLTNTTGLNLFYNEKLIIENIQLVAKINGVSEIASVASVENENNNYHITFKYSAENYKTLVSFTKTCFLNSLLGKYCAPAHAD